MKRFVAFLSVAVMCLAGISAMNLANVPCGVRQLSGRRGRVKGGQEAHRGQFPWSASVQVNGAHFCMGAVINNEYVLTAAHCFVGKPSGAVTVTLGGHDLTEVEPGQVTIAVAERIIHEGYHPGTFDNDIALLKLENKISWNGAVQPVCLPSTGTKKFVGMKGTIAGWGYLDEWRDGGERPDTLHWVELPILSPETCQQWFTEAKKKIKVAAGKICAGYKEGGKDSCQADSGGALTVERGGEVQLAGVVSAGIGCGRPGLPGIYTDVTSYTKWIVGEISARTTF
ncbi:trypsin-1-like [Amphibalanus amphitrite]|uniref:trypsin-1-like n=1 Tax=Amphibalanus amphitrite TaxID=1232801 RepID=UPI001C92B218|nr:trypsin-1-like [Amphibalanus amphitrite]XP_043227596.1 trypsin-1-like [Amphibalanus amphitrite]